MSRRSSALFACCLLTACAQTVTSGTAQPDAGLTVDAPVIAPDAPVDASPPTDAGPVVIPDGGLLTFGVGDGVGRRAPAPNPRYTP